MLSTTMSNDQVMEEVYMDLWNLLKGQRLQVLLHSYNRERRKLRVKLQSEYTKIYESVSSNRNKWVILFSKPPAIKEYKGDPNILIFTYVKEKRGITVYKPMTCSQKMYDKLAIYSDSFFVDYAAAEGLHDISPVDIVKTFFLKNGYSTLGSIEFEGDLVPVAISKQGLSLGVYMPDIQSFEYNSFVSKEVLGERYDAIEKQMQSVIQNQILEIINDSEFDKVSYDLHADAAVVFN